MKVRPNIGSDNWHITDRYISYPDRDMDYPMSAAAGEYDVRPPKLRFAMIKYGSPEKVYVENEWNDGPRAGIADINGIPHWFKSLFDEGEDENLGTFVVWPVDKPTLDLEIEQWCIFVEWNTLYESGQANTNSHPGHGGRNARWDEIETLLKKSRSDAPAWALRATAQFSHIDRDVRYAESGPDYMLKWSIL